MFDINKIQVVTPEQFPNLPRKMNAIGNVELLNRKCIGVVGSRKIDNYSCVWLENKISELQKDWVVVSGLALGTDAIAHNSAIDNNLGTIAVLPSGICNITPRRNIKIAKRIVKEGGLLLSEYRPKQGLDSNFRQYKERNRVIVNISNCLLVPQFDERSGTRSTVDFAQKDNKRIFVQGKSNYSGNNYIIKNNNYRTIVL